MLQISPDKKLPPLSVLQNTGWKLDLTVSGQSMEPLLRAGDTVTIQCKQSDRLQEGDVVCFKKGDDFVLHRLIEIKSSGQKCFYEKGDAETKGQWISGVEVLGVLAMINGKVVDESVAQKITSFSRHEKNASEILGRMNLSPPPSRLSRGWRKIKTACRQIFVDKNH